MGQTYAGRAVSGPNEAGMNRLTAVAVADFETETLSLPFDLRFMHQEFTELLQLLGFVRQTPGNEQKGLR